MVYHPAVDALVIDPGLGFYYGNLTDSQVRIDYQTKVLLRTREKLTALEAKLAELEARLEDKAE